MVSNKVSQEQQSLNLNGLGERFNSFNSLNTLNSLNSLNSLDERLNSMKSLNNLSSMTSMNTLNSLGERFKSLLDTGTTGYQTNNKNVKYEEIKSRCLVSAEKRLKNLENQKLPLKSLWKAQSRSEMNTLVCVAKLRGSKYGPDQRTGKRIESQMKIRFRCFPCRKKFNQLAKLLLHRYVQSRSSGDVGTL